MDFDEALEAILELNRIWEERNGHATFEDFGLRRTKVVRSRGNSLPVPERWRNYPGVRTIEQVMFEDLK
jgi:hypothetical protein